MNRTLGGVGMRIKKSKIIRVLVITFTIIGGFIFYFFYGTPWDLVSHKNKVNEYLENTYNKDFVIERTSFDFFHRTYHSYAHPKENPELSFYVGQNISTKEIEDGYDYQLWQKQAKDELDPIVEEIFPDNFNYAVEVSPIKSLSISEKSHNLSFKEYTTVQVGVSMDDYVITNENRDSEIERSYQLLVSLKEKGIKFNHFSISYKNKTIQLTPDKIRSISSSDELERWLTDYR